MCGTSTAPDLVDDARTTTVVADATYTEGDFSLIPSDDVSLKVHTYAFLAIR